jgi:tRNA pseudouridine55 synthase
MTYAGRLDPMASGLLLILTGDETKNKEKYLKLDKEYKFEVLFGFATDTYDLLGIPKVNNFLRSSDLRGPVPARPFKNYSPLEFRNAILYNLKFFTGKFIQKYPIYSSKTVKGKPLFTYARSGEDVETPEREVDVKNFKFIKLRKIDNKKLLENIEKRIKKVQGDFRQEEILKIWREKLMERKDFYIVNFKIKCSSGTYVRGIANSLGEKLNVPSLAFSIKRTKVGKYVI